MADGIKWQTPAWDLFAPRSLPNPLFPKAHACRRCDTRHLPLPGGFCRNRACGAAMPEDGSNTRVLRWIDGREVPDA